MTWPAHIARARVALQNLLVALCMMAASAHCTLAADFIFYDEALPGGWIDGSWNTSNNLGSATPSAQSGTVSAAVSFTNPYGAFALANWNVPASTSGYNAISLWIRGSTSARYLELFVEATNGGARVATAIPDVAPGTWQNVVVYLSDLGLPASVTRVGLANDSQRMNWTNVTQPEYNTTFFVDNLRLTNVPLPPPPPPQAGPALGVNAQAQLKPISKYIYGGNWEKQAAFAAEIGLPVNRWGGDATPRYNWNLNASNPGFNWYFENRIEGPTANGFTDFNRAAGADTVMTLPLIGWAAKDGFSCGFSVTKYGAQTGADNDCGTGVTAANTLIAGNDPRDSSIATTPAFYRPWIQSLVASYGRADQGGIKFYNLDNEPGIWSGTHRDIVPTGITHTDLLARSIAAGEMLKSVDPSAKILGPAEDGWTRYIVSGADSHNGNFGARYDGLWAVEWYLREMRAYETRTGTRLLDYLDLHYYPQAPGIFGATGSKAQQALRLRTVKSLWDASYPDESWIGNSGFGAVKLIPRMRDWVNTYYPGTKLAITEYNFGALNHINGALAQADALGVFGREGLDLATLWAPPETWNAETGLFTDKPGAYAFRIYRNYDGNGGKFGDISVQAGSADQDELSIYGSLDTGDGSLKLVVINKTDTPLDSTLSIQGHTGAATANTYRYSSNNLAAIETGMVVVANGAIVERYPPSSITLIRIAASGTVNNPPVPTAAPMQIPQGNSGTTQVVANDPDAGDTFTYSIAAAAQHGTASVSATGLVRYTPNARTFAGSDSVTVVVTDNTNASGTVVIPITVFSITWNSAPSAADDSASVSRNRAQVINLLANDHTDSGSLDPASVVITARPTHGRVTLNRSNGMVTYNPGRGYVGNDRFSYTVKNTLGAVSNVASVSITVK
jgi:hypothetical protein